MLPPQTWCWWLGGDWRRTVLGAIETELGYSGTGSEDHYLVAGIYGQCSSCFTQLQQWPRAQVTNLHLLGRRSIPGNLSSVPKYALLEKLCTEHSVSLRAPCTLRAPSTIHSSKPISSRHAEVVAFDLCSLSMMLGKHFASEPRGIDG